MDDAASVGVVVAPREPRALRRRCGGRRRNLAPGTAAARGPVLLRTRARARSALRLALLLLSFPSPSRSRSGAVSIASRRGASAGGAVAGVVVVTKKFVGSVAAPTTPGAGDSGHGPPCRLSGALTCTTSPSLTTAMSSSCASAYPSTRSSRSRCDSQRRPSDACIDLASASTVHLDDAPNVGAAAAGRGNHEYAISGLRLDSRRRKGSTLRRTRAAKPCGAAPPVEGESAAAIVVMFVGSFSRFGSSHVARLIFMAHL